MEQEKEFGRMSTEKQSGISEDKAGLFSVIILTYCQRHLLNDCIDTILSQRYPNIELVICDDSSADFNVEEVREYIEKNKRSNLKRCIVHKHPHNLGTTANAQAGIQMSSGKYFKLHAGDDMLADPSVLDRMAVYLEKEEVNIVAARAHACLQDGTLTGDVYPPYPAVAKMMEANAQEQFTLIGTQSWGEFINAPSVFWCRSFFDKMGGFDPKYKYTEDWPMWLKITKAGYRITSVNEITTVYRYGGISNDASSLNLVLGSAHYDECIRMLQDEVLPVFEENHQRLKAFRCKQSMWCIKARIAHETKWMHWSLLKKVLWKCQNFSRLLIAWAYRRRTWGTQLHIRKEIKVMAGLWIMYHFDAQVWPGLNARLIWGGLFVLLLCVTALKLVAFLGIKMSLGLIKALKKVG